MKNPMIRTFSSIAIAAFGLIAATHIIQDWKVNKRLIPLAHRSTEAPINRDFSIILQLSRNMIEAEQTIQSIISQKYPHYEVFVLYPRCAEEKRFSTPKNFHWVAYDDADEGLISPLYRQVHQLHPSKIVIPIFEGCSFSHSNTLLDLNHYYADPKTWVTLGTATTLPSFENLDYRRIAKKNISNKTLRRKVSNFSPFVTFYARVFHQIHYTDLLNDGKFFPAYFIDAWMVPLLELSNHHFFYIQDQAFFQKKLPKREKEMLYNTRRAMLKHLDDRPVYPKMQKKEARYQVDIVAFSYDRPMQLYAFLESLQLYGKNTGQQTVIYRARDDAFEVGYDIVKKAFPDVHWIKQDHKKALDEFKAQLLQATFNSPSEHIAFAVDDIICKEPFDFNEAIVALARTKAHAFFYRLGDHITHCHTMNIPHKIPPLQKVYSDIYTWTFKEGNGDWNYPNSVDMVVYKKSRIKSLLTDLKCTFPNDFEAAWACKADHNLKGLCHQRTKIVNIPINIVSTSYSNRNMNAYSTEELLALFLEGNKIDISKLQGITNASPHIDFNVEFIPR